MDNLNEQNEIVMAIEKYKKRKSITTGFACLLTATIMFILFVCYMYFFVTIPNNVNIHTTTYSAETVEKLSTDVTASVEKVYNSAVEVYANTTIGSSAGSGVIINLDETSYSSLNSLLGINEYYVVTNYHVIEKAYEIFVNLTKADKMLSATLIGSNKYTDIAVLKIKYDGDSSYIAKATIGDSSTLKLGELCFAIGNPLGQLGGSVSVGNISFLNRTIKIDSIQMSLIQTTTAINSGNSGGGLFNSSGDLVGIVNAKAGNTQVGDTIEGIGFAIPINKVLTTIVNILLEIA